MSTGKPLVHIGTALKNFQRNYIDTIRDELSEVFRDKHELFPCRNMIYLSGRNSLRPEHYFISVLNDVTLHSEVGNRMYITNSIRINMSLDSPLTEILSVPYLTAEIDKIIKRHPRKYRILTSYYIEPVLVEDINNTNTILSCELRIHMNVREVHQQLTFDSGFYEMLNSLQN